MSQKTLSDTRFKEFDLAPELLQAVDKLGFEYCTPIQAAVLQFTLNGDDAIGKAQTGTGKTAAFLITIINDLLKTPLNAPAYNGEPRALIIAPTRELALQIEKDARELTRFSKLRVLSVVGGMNMQKQKDVLNNEVVDILVATPGRLIDHARSRDVWLDRVEIMVLDEADRMLDMGFIPDVKRIIAMTPPKANRQTLLFSATFNQDVLNLAKRWTWDAHWVEIVSDEATTATVEQKFYIVSSDQKESVLVNMIEKENLSKVMVFCNRRDQVRHLTERLTKKGINCDQLSGEIAQNKRLRTLEDFRNGKIAVLVATDVAGRGIHIDGISHVVNFNLPEDNEDYVHRIGRTGRAGETGTSISFCCEEDGFLVPDLEAAIGKKLELEYPPDAWLKTEA